MFRGVSAGLIGTALMVSVAAVGPAIASGAENRDDQNRPLPVAAQREATIWDLPTVRYLAHVHRIRHHSSTASRARSRTPLTGSPQTVAHAMLLRRGWSEAQWSCLNALWTRESRWDPYANNGSSGAYGIPQALPATKMASAGADWRTNPITQISWGLSYIADTYGSPCGALGHSSAYGYY
jgi:hypothetical protein